MTARRKIDSLVEQRAAVDRFVPPVRLAAVAFRTVGIDTVDLLPELTVNLVPKHKEAVKMKAVAAVTKLVTLAAAETMNLRSEIER